MRQRRRKLQTVDQLNGPSSVQSPLPVFRGSSWEEHVSAWIQACETITEYQWMLGAIVESLRLRFGKEALARFAGEVRRSHSAVYQYAQVYSFYSPKPRKKNGEPIASDYSECVAYSLDWTHFLVAMY